MRDGAAAAQILDPSRMFSTSVSILIMLLALPILGTIATTQPHPNGYAGVHTAGFVYVVDGGGAIKSVTTGANGAHGLVMSGDNRELLVAHTDGSIVRVDPQTTTVLSTLVSGLEAFYKIEADHHGDYYLTGMNTLWKLENGSLTTISNGLNPHSYGGMAIDIDTGELLVQSRASPDPLQRVSRNGGVVTTLGAGANSRYGIAQHIPTGDVFVGSCCGDYPAGQNLFVLRSGQVVFRSWLASAGRLIGTYSLKADRASASSQRLILGAFQPVPATRGDGGFFAVDLATKIVSTITRINMSLYETEILYRRNICAARVDRGRWDLGLHVPEDAGKPYVLAVSGSGVRPGLRLNDGRSAALLPDQLTMIGLQYGLAPWVRGLRGTLDASGSATAKINLKSFGPAVNGLRLWFVALILDPVAPNGIRTITDPLVFVAEGL